MGIKTVPHTPYSLDLAPCDFWLFPKLRGCCYETIEEMKEAVTKVIDTLTQEDFHGGLPEVVGMVEQGHCSRRRLLRRGLEFHVCTINKSAHTKKSLETYRMHLVVRQTPEESRWTYRPKHWGNKNKDEDNSLKTLNDKNTHELFSRQRSHRYCYMAALQGR